MRIRIFTGLLLLGLMACNREKVPLEQEPSKREYSVQSVLWQQNAAEYRALCLQSFALAKSNLESAIAAHRDSSCKLAVITDIDETILDNSPYNAVMIKKDVNYTPESWAEWVGLKEARAIPGAVDFVQFALDHGVEVFYISNRQQGHEQLTADNMHAVGFPKPTLEKMSFKGSTSSKKERRKVISEMDSIKVVMLLGDNLGDFAEAFDGKSTEDRNATVDSLGSFWGGKFIVFPNPMYGDWESKGIYEGYDKRYNWTETQKDSLRRAKLRGY